MKKRIKLTFGIVFFHAFISVSYAGLTRKIKEMCSKRIFITLLVSLCICPLVTAQEPGPFSSHADLAVPAEHDAGPLLRFLQQHRKMSYEEKGACTDTIRFAHDNRWFFTMAPPFLPLDNGGWIIGYTGDDPAVYLYEANGSFVKQVTGHGQGPGEITGGISLAKQRNNFYISEEDQRKILCLDNDGHFLREIHRSRTWAGKTFVVSPSSPRYYYYTIQGNHHHLFTMGDLDKGMIAEFGDIDPANTIAMMAGPVRGVACDENGFLFVIKPAEYGIDIYREPDQYLGRASADPPPFFKPPKAKEIKKIQKNHRYSIELFFNYMHTEKIFSLGRSLLVVMYKKTYLSDGSRITWDVIARGLREKKVSNMRFLTYLEFWRTDGTRLGHIELGGTYPGIAYAEDGYLYYWREPQEPDADGIYPNPLLLRYDLWKELGWR